MAKNDNYISTLLQPVNFEQLKGEWELKAAKNASEELSKTIKVLFPYNCCVFQSALVSQCKPKKGDSIKAEWIPCVADHEEAADMYLPCSEPEAKYCVQGWSTYYI